MYKFDYVSIRDRLHQLLTPKLKNSVLPSETAFYLPDETTYKETSNLKTNSNNNNNNYLNMSTQHSHDAILYQDNNNLHQIINNNNNNNSHCYNQNHKTTSSTTTSNSSALAAASSNQMVESFWEPGNYKKTTKRIEDGYRLCNDLVQLIQERSDIEKNYAKSLHQWSKKWNDIISRGPEYGTTEAAWKAILIEAERVNEMHLKSRDKLLENVVNDIKQWQKEKFHKNLIQIKEKKEIEDEFKRVQKPWSKLLDKVNKCKQEYHLSCKNERTLSNQERNAASDSSISLDQMQRIKERLLKAREDVQKTKEKYEIALKDINQENQNYVQEMSQVFDRCQEMEEQRLNFFKDILFNIHDCLNISKDDELTNIYEEYRHTLQNADSIKDLNWWANTYGIGMRMEWPQFEPFSEEFRDIIKDHNKTRKNDGITLINQHQFSEELPDWNEVSN